MIKWYAYHRIATGWWAVSEYRNLDDRDPVATFRDKQDAVNFTHSKNESLKPIPIATPAKF